MSNLNPRQFKTQMMPVADLIPHAADREYDERSTAYVGHLAESMKKHGYSATPGGGRGRQWMKREHGVLSVDESPVTLNHEKNYSYIEPGNHRVAAAHLAGIEQIPVRVRDFRVNGSVRARRADPL